MILRNDEYLDAASRRYVVDAIESYWENYWNESAMSFDQAQEFLYELEEGGCVIPGSGLVTTDEIKADFAKVVEQFKKFQDHGCDDPNCCGPDFTESENVVWDDPDAEVKLWDPPVFGGENAMDSGANNDVVPWITCTHCLATFNGPGAFDRFTEHMRGHGFNV